MSYVFPGGSTPDYYPCRYGASRLVFRGPTKPLSRPYVAILGGSETYGRYVSAPYPALLEEALGRPVLNLGCVNAGLDAFLNDPDVMDVAASAAVTVVQVLGAQNLSNRFYSVHPRRNDRFLGPTGLLRSLYREVDFAEITFTRQLLQTLHAVEPTRFSLIAEELRAAWVTRMAQLLDHLGGRKVLVWIAPHAPPEAGQFAPGSDGPLLIDAHALAAVRPHASSLITACLPPEGVDGMEFPPMEAAMAAQMPGPRGHGAVATALIPVIEGLLQ